MWKMNKHHTFLLFILFAAISAGSSMCTHGCTLFGAAGDTLRDGGTVMVKNRDWRPEGIQSLEMVVPKGNGYSYLALMVKGGRTPGIKAGVNEAGLSVMSATASAVPRSVRRKARRSRNLLGKVLAKAANVEEGLKIIGKMAGARYITLSDRHEIAMVEIGMQGEKRIWRRSRGVLAHTNHYLHPELTSLNTKAYNGSLTRLNRINHLLVTNQTLTPADLLRFSTDRNDGPDASLFRTGGKPGVSRNRAIWLVRFYQNGGGFLRVMLFNEKGLPEIHCLDLDKVFQ